MANGFRIRIRVLLVTFLATLLLSACAVDMEEEPSAGSLRHPPRIWAHLRDLQFVNHTHGWAIGSGVRDTLTNVDFLDESRGWAAGEQQRRGPDDRSQKLLRFHPVLRCDLTVSRGFDGRKQVLDQGSQIAGGEWLDFPQDVLPGDLGIPPGVVGGAPPSRAFRQGSRNRFR